MAGIALHELTTSRNRGLPGLTSSQQAGADASNAAFRNAFTGGRAPGTGGSGVNSVLGGGSGTSIESSLPEVFGRKPAPQNNAAPAKNSAKKPISKNSAQVDSTGSAANVLLGETKNKANTAKRTLLGQI